MQYTIGHFLEHLDRGIVLDFLIGCYRVLKPNGIIRIVVPDLEYIAKKYLDAISGISNNIEGSWAQYDQALYELFDQMVRIKSTGIKQQSKGVAIIEQMLRGGPGKIGELHRWMYDKYSLTKLLSEAGFINIKQHFYNTSDIYDWEQQNLDAQSDGGEYKENSLYIEGRKPA